MQAVRIACLLIVVGLAGAAAAQSQPAAPAEQPQPQAQTEAKPAGPVLPPGVPEDLPEIVLKQFGPNFEIAFQRVMTRRYLKEPKRPPLHSLLVGDLDGDGAEDAIIVATAKNPFGAAPIYRYAVIDPFFASFGYANPQITSGFSEEDPAGNYLLLVIHGVGKEGWRAPVPRAKFVMINLPFNTVNVAQIEGKKKKLVHAIILEEDGTNQSSIVVWDGKRYRWINTGGQG